MPSKKLYKLQNRKLQPYNAEQHDDKSLFSTRVMKKIKNSIDHQQPYEQTGFTAGYSTNDHLQTINQLIK